MEQARVQTLAYQALPRQIPLFSAYVAGDRAVTSRFPHAPGDREAFSRLVETIRQRPYPRAEVAAVLAAQAETFGAPPEARRHIQRLTDPASVAVVTGQQVGLFGGPLFTLYKALTVIAVARQMEGDLGSPVIPVFWMASEDHDFAEVDHLALLDRHDYLERLRYTPPEGFGADLPATHRLGPEIEALQTSLLALSSAGPVSSQIAELLGTSYRAGDTLVQGFGRLLSHLLGPHGLVLVDPSDPRLKAAILPLLLQELESAPTTTRLVQEAGARLKALGYRPQLGQRPDGVNLFLLDGGRRALRRVGEQVALVGTREWMSTHTLTERLSREPAVFSPNVVLRPITQDSLFPTIAYIAGPNEIAYFAQLREVYAHFHIPMPIILPRASLTLVEGRIERLLRILDLSLADLGPDPEVTLGRIARRRLPRAFERRLERALATTARTFQDLGKLVVAFDPTLVPRVAAAEEGLTRHLKDLERRLIRSYKRRSDEIATQVRRLHTHLLPQGDLQERGLGFITYLLRYGPRLVDVLSGAIDGPGWEHRVVFLGERQHGAGHSP